MHSSVTGYRKGATSAVRCIDAAALIAAAILRKNPTAEVIPFESDVVEISLNPRDSVMTNAQKLANIPGRRNELLRAAQNAEPQKSERRCADLRFRQRNRGLTHPFTDASAAAERKRCANGNEFTSRNKNAKLVCIDIQPSTHTQAKERADILNVGGFSDQVFNLIAEFAGGNLEADHWGWCD